MIERFIDYLQASMWLSEPIMIEKQYKAVSPVRFYKRGYLHPMGFRMYFGGIKPNLALVVASGETMQSLRNDDYLDSEVLNWVLDNGGKVSRLDLAVTEWNTFDGLFELSDVERWYTRGLIDSPLIKGGCKEIATINEQGRVAETLYIGDMAKRAKRGIFRAYNKGIQLNLGDYMATRIELELKRDKAHATARRLAQTNDIAGNFRASFNVRSKDFERLMDADIVPTYRGKADEKKSIEDEQNKRWDWLLNQVAPALKQAIADDRAKGNYDEKLIKFLGRAGLLKEMRETADNLAKAKYRAKLESNDLFEGK